jgi:hypothetical protein
MQNLHILTFLTNIFGALINMTLETVDLIYSLVKTNLNSTLLISLVLVV